MSAAQIALFATGPTHRATDPSTSKAATPSAAHLSEVQARIMALFASPFDHVAAVGLSAEQIVDLLGDVYGPTAVKRISELAKAGLLVDRGIRRQTRQGRQSIVWTLA